MLNREGKRLVVENNGEKRNPERTGTSNRRSEQTLLTGKVFKKENQDGRSYCGGSHAESGNSEKEERQ